MPDDGLTTRQRRTRPLLIVHTGPGKGKSTAAFGMALRAWNQALAGRGVPVREVGEVAHRRGAGAQGARGQRRGRPVTWHKMGEGWSWIQRPGTEEDHAADAREGWEQIKRDLAAETYRFYVLDEFTYPLKWGWLDLDDVIAALTRQAGEPACRDHRQGRARAAGRGG
ncbi:hypothetical protein GCM10020220_097830 [Nonomuraea rubra]